MRQLTFLMMILCLWGMYVHAEAPLLEPQAMEERLKRLERLLEGRKELDFLSKITQLQVKERELRGQIEKQNFEMERLKKNQIQLYTDLEKRIQGLEQKFSEKISSNPSNP